MAILRRTGRFTPPEPYNIPAMAVAALLRSLSDESLPETEEDVAWLVNDHLSQRARRMFTDASRRELVRTSICRILEALEDLHVRRVSCWHWVSCVVLEKDPDDDESPDTLIQDINRGLRIDPAAVNPPRDPEEMLLRSVESRDDPTWDRLLNRWVEQGHRAHPIDGTEAPSAEVAAMTDEELAAELLRIDAQMASVTRTSAGAAHLIAILRQLPDEKDLEGTEVPQVPLIERTWGGHGCTDPPGQTITASPHQTTGPPAITTVLHSVSSVGAWAA